MAPTTTTTASSSDKKKVSRPSGGGARKKLSAYNKFMRNEMARLKAEQPNMAHQERFKTATANWKTAKENPKTSGA